MTRKWAQSKMSRIVPLLLLATTLHAQPAGSGTPGAAVLKPADYRHYVTTFREQEREATGKLYEGEGDEDTWTWMQREIPWFDASDKQFEEMYYFRWYAWKKHLVKTPTGYIITEWLPKPAMADFGALPDAAPFHIAEAPAGFADPASRKRRRTLLVLSRR